MPRTSSSARRYADAAFEVALRDGTVAAWRNELEAASEALSEPALARALANPAIPLEGVEHDPGAASRPLTSRLDLVVATVGARVSRPVLNLIVLLLRRGRIELLPRVSQEFGRLDDLRNQVIHANATSAAPLGPDEVRALTARLEQLSGGRVELTTTTDPEILGGVVVRLGDRLIDGSVRGRLERLRSKLASGAL